MNEYFGNLNVLPTSKVIKDMRKYVETNKIPVINDEALLFFLHLLDVLKPKRILEIGTAIGFWAINIATYDEEVLIDTIEKSEFMFSEASKNIRKAKLIERINVFLGDALEFELDKLSSEYDIIFIDASKAQYIKFFEKYEHLLTPDGVIISDNLLFHGFVNNSKMIESKNLRHLVEKVEAYNNFLARNRNYDTKFFAIGDGIAVSRKV
ncbi:MAG TPA: O-methyltransferase [Acholeplasmataceae bacterium]|nr:O-methyltransferase [Acholeplasmataceae bacterium]